MNGLPHAWLGSIRRRPAQERRILAVATFISAAAIITALWITSLAHTITDFAAPPPGAAEVSEQSSSESLRDLATPFQTLREGLQEALSEFSRFFEDVNSLEQPDQPGALNASSAAEDDPQIPAAPAASPSLPPSGAGATSTAPSGEHSGGLGDFLFRTLQSPPDSP